MANNGVKARQNTQTNNHALEASEPWAELEVADSPPLLPPPQPLVSQPRGSSQQAAATAPQLLGGLSDSADGAAPGGTGIFQLGCMARTQCSTQTYIWRGMSPLATTAVPISCSRQPAAAQSPAGIMSFPASAGRRSPGASATSWRLQTSSAAQTLSCCGSRCSAVTAYGGARQRSSSSTETAKTIRCAFWRPARYCGDAAPALTAPHGGKPVVGHNRLTCLWHALLRVDKACVHIYSL